MFDKLRFINSRIFSILPQWISRIVSKCFPECLHDANIINDQPIGLAFSHAVSPGDSLHQRVGFHGFVKVETRQRLDIKTRKPHCTDENNPKRMIRILEVRVQMTFLHLLTVRNDVKSPLLERLDLILLFRYDDRHFCLFHPFDFPLELHALLLRVHPLCFGFQLSYLLFPIFLHIVVHSDTRHLVVTDKHCLACRPKIAVMVDKVLGN